MADSKVKKMVARLAMSAWGSRLDWVSVSLDGLQGQEQADLLEMAQLLGWAARQARAMAVRLDELQEECLDGWARREAAVKDVVRPGMEL